MTKPNHMMKTTAPMPSEMLMVSWASTPILVALKRSDEVTKKLSSCSRTVSYTHLDVYKRQLH